MLDFSKLKTFQMCSVEIEPNLYISNFRLTPCRAKFQLISVSKRTFCCCWGGGGGGRGEGWITLHGKLEEIGPGLQFTGNKIGITFHAKTTFFTRTYVNI